MPAIAWSSGAAQRDALRSAVLRFCDDRLYQIVGTYDSERIQGLTEADLVQAVSRTYGEGTTPDVQIPFKSSYGETARVISRWENAEYLVDLVPARDQYSYALIISMKRVTQLADAAIKEANRLDVIEAPQREIDLQDLKEADNRRELEKARSVNLRNFRP